MLTAVHRGVLSSDRCGPDSAEITLSSYDDTRWIYNAMAMAASRSITEVRRLKTKMSAGPLYGTALCDIIFSTVQLSVILSSLRYSSL